MMRQSNNRNINPRLLKQFKNKQRKQRSVSEYVEAILKGNRVVLSQAITLIESTRTEHRLLAQEIIDKCIPHSGKSLRIGITGTPGVGKSTFIETLGKHITDLGEQVAVLAIDPTSQITKGSILGDKTRMETLSCNPKAFIRPSPAGDSLGGVAQKTRESILLCEAAGFSRILVETVGVGQSEIAVHSMTDFFLLLLLPGAGDELQGMKRGIVEMADLIAINKADGDNLLRAKIARREYKNALHLYPMKESQWLPKVLTCSALHQEGIIEIWELITNFYEFTKTNDYFYINRQKQAKYYLYEGIKQELTQLFYNNTKVKTKLSIVEQAVLKGEMSPFKGVKLLLTLFSEK